MKILIACEESQRVCTAFREKGHEAYSCDLLPTSGDHPDWHIQDDVVKYLDYRWDMIIAFPPCTYLTVTGNSWFNLEVYKNKAVERYKKRLMAIDFFMKFVLNDCPLIAVENPIGIMSSVFRKPDQIIEPYMFGDPYNKKTCLWLKNLTKLIPDNIVVPEDRIIFDSGKSMPKWYADSWGLSPDERAVYRSKTFPGIAKAMADQWG